MKLKLKVMKKSSMKKRNLKKNLNAILLKQQAKRKK
jgi:hypothetical protein